MQKEAGTLENYLLKNERKNTSKVVEEGTKNAKFAKLDYEVLKYNEEINLSVLKIHLHTGRHHQIRVQLANIEHSIYGDQKYRNKRKRKTNSSLGVQTKIYPSSYKRANGIYRLSRKNRFMENIVNIWGRGSFGSKILHNGVTEFKNKKL